MYNIYVYTWYKINKYIYAYIYDIIYNIYKYIYDILYLYENINIHIYIDINAEYANIYLYVYVFKSPYPKIATRRSRKWHEGIEFDFRYNGHVCAT